MVFKYRIVLQGTRPDDKTSLIFSLGDFDPVVWADVLNAANQIRGSLVAITDANVAGEFITGTVSEDNQLPAGADTTDELVIITHLNAPATAEKLHALRVPAPVDTVWNPDLQTLDMANADVVQFVQQISQHAEVSDGETINTSSGVNGMKRGYFRSRAKKLG